MALMVGAMMASLTSGASAQEACECDCYFSPDCPGSSICFYGESFTTEDSCWWRQPKPDSVPGAGCDGDFFDWGQCDGKCTSSLIAGSALAGEDQAKVKLGVAAWGETMTKLSRTGAGAPTEAMVQRIDDIGFDDPLMTYRLWRTTIDVMLLARGADSLVFPQQPGGFGMTDVAMADLSDDPGRLRNGELAIQALLAEIDLVGSGALYLARIDESLLDEKYYERLCEGDSDRRACLHSRLYDLGGYLSQAGGGGGGSGGADGDISPPCPGCVGDCTFNDAVDFEDLLLLLANWTSTTWTCGDTDGSGAIDFADLLWVLSAWGPCAPDG